MAEPSTMQPPPPAPDDLLTLEEAAGRCRVSYETFRRWVAKAVLPHKVVGPYRSLRVERREVEKLIRDGKPAD